MNNEYAGYIEKYNKFGYIQINFYDEYKTKKYCKRRIKCHVSNSGSIAAMWNTFPILGYYFVDDVVSLSPDIESSEVYFIATLDEYGDVVLVNMERCSFKYTKDVLNAWFTFDENQAMRLASKLSRKNLKPYLVKSASELQIDYE